MGMILDWSVPDAAAMLEVPRADDDKYTRGVLGVITGSSEYPGAAVIGVEAAMHTGLGMLRYVGPKRVAEFVLQRRPEVVTQPGRVQAWLLGSGMSAETRGDASTATLRDALADGVPTVIDAGALDLLDAASGATVITPHARELSGLIAAEPDDIRRDPARHAAIAAEQLGVVVLLKGSQTHVASPEGEVLRTPIATPWLATAGTGDALGGVLGALLTTQARQLERLASAGRAGMLARLAASASVIHALAAERASAGGPFTVLGLTEQLSPCIAGLLR